MIRDRVRVLGGGPSGATFSIVYLREARSVPEVRVYDGDCPYRKPCGEAILSIGIDKYEVQPPVIEEIRDFYIYVDGKLLVERHYNTPPWFIVDKKLWIELMRNKIEKEGGKFSCARVRPSSLNDDLIIDARGPFTEERKLRVPISRAIVDGKAPHEGVIMELDFKNVGFYWIFPSKGGKLNVGYGSIQVKDPANYLLNYIGKKLTSQKIVEISSSIITLSGPSQTANGKFFKIGEAAGMVFPLSGEGIRPSITHSREFARALALGDTANEAYLESFKAKDVAQIVRQIKWQRRLLNIFSTIPPRIRRNMISALSLSIDRYIRYDELPFSSLLGRF
ncbi:MAG: NAD(P)/FAD-dependent oxidoreductase [Fervidicoccaceae archaeon]